ncbi:hypothetical protein Tco_1538976 [Tanacetum coccineum]
MTDSSSSPILIKGAFGLCVYLMSLKKKDRQERQENQKIELLKLTALSQLRNFCSVSLESLVERSNAIIELESEWSRLGKPVATAATDAGVTTSVLH